MLNVLIAGYMVHSPVDGPDANGHGCTTVKVRVQASERETITANVIGYGRRVAAELLKVPAGAFVVIEGRATLGRGETGGRPSINVNAYSVQTLATHAAERLRAELLASPSDLGSGQIGGQAAHDAGVTGNA